MPIACITRQRIVDLCRLVVVIGLVWSAQTAQAQFLGCRSVNEIPRVECEALVALYNSTDGASWTDNTNWLDNHTPSTWAGVTVAGFRVTQLALVNNNLTGSIPPELGDLSNLTQLSLSNNDLSGGLPAELGDLSSLVTLQVNGNANLEGSLPPSLTNLTALDVFRFQDTMLCEPSDPAFQEWLDGITVLGRTGETCPFSGCSDVTEIPQVECEALVAHYNSTDGDNWANNTNWLENNTPSTWAWVRVEGGTVTEIDHGDGNNGLSGTIAPELGNLSNLIKLTLISNDLRGNIPPELGNLSNLTLLNLGGELTGSIPPELGDLSKLEELSLSNNQLMGNIPAALGNLSNLHSLRLNNNQLTGSIPSELGNLSNLEWLVLSSNDLTGNLPPELGDLSSLVTLQVNGNAGLEGPLPLNLTNLTELHTFSFDGTMLCEPPSQAFQDWLAGINSVSGTGVTCNFSCSNVTEIPEVECEALVAHYNSTDGDNWTNNTNWLENNTPSTWIGVTVEGGSVTSIELVSNGLAGRIPAELGSLSSLTDLYLSLNQLTGSIPSELGNLADLTVLNLSGSFVSGSIPMELGNLANLAVLDLSGTNVSGSLPAELANLANLTYLDLRESNLSGSLPAELGNLANLTHLDLSGTFISGSLPAELANLTNLTYLALQDNNLSGSLPAELGNLTNLEMLQVSENAELTGPLPLSLTNLTKLHTFSFHRTMLCEPPSQAFQDWLGGISLLQSTGVICSPGQLTVIRPNGGETWTSGTAEQIQWTSQDVPGSVKIDLLQQGIAELTITGGTANDGSFTWDLPGALPEREDYRVRITSLADETVQDESDADFSVIAPGFACALVEEIPQAECEALVALYNSTDGDDWLNNDGWLQNGTPSTWYGPTVENGSITRLDLSSNALTGSLPAELGDLSSLESLRVNSNVNLSGPLPLSLTNLAALRYFRFQDTMLCEPSDPTFQAWLAGLETFESTNVSCSEPGLNPTAEDCLDGSLSQHFAFDDFATTDGLHLVGDAATESSLIRLTTNAFDQQGSAWFAEKQTVNEGFFTAFAFRFTDQVNSGADGLSFNIHNRTEGTTLLTGEFGPGNAALTVAYRTFDSDGESTEDDISGNYIAVIQGSRLAEQDLDPLGLQLEDGTAHSAAVCYLEGHVSVFLDGMDVLTDVPLEGGSLGGAVDGTGRAWVGFGARTGGAAANHDVLRWSFTTPEIVATSVEEEGAVPEGFVLRSNYPNPFNPRTVIEYRLPAWASGKEVQLSVHNVLGKQIRVLVRGDAEPGMHRVVWDGRDAGGRRVSSGVYVYRLQAGPYVQARRMLLLK